MTGGHPENLVRSHDLIHILQTRLYFTDILGCLKSLGPISDVKTQTGLFFCNLYLDTDQVSSVSVQVQMVRLKTGGLRGSDSRSNGVDGCYVAP